MSHTAHLRSVCSLEFVLALMSARHREAVRQQELTRSTRPPLALELQPRGEAQKLHVLHSCLLEVPPPNPSPPPSSTFPDPPVRHKVP